MLDDDRVTEVLLLFLMMILVVVDDIDIGERFGLALGLSLVQGREKRQVSTVCCLVFMISIE